MKKTALLLFLTVLSACITLGCSSGSKKHIIVREKSELNTDSYRQTSGTPDTLAGQLQVPEKNLYSGKYIDDPFQLICSAEVIVPETDQVPVFKVGQKPFNQTWIDQVTDVFFGNHPVYDYEKYNQPTREWISEKLRQLRSYQAEGNLDPYGYIASAQAAGYENPESFYNLQSEIQRWEQIYETSPEAVEKVEVIPGFGSGAPDNCFYREPSAAESSSAETASSDDPFFGIVEMDGGIFLYKLKRSGSFHMDIGIVRGDTEISDKKWSESSWFQPYWLQDSSDAPKGNLPSREAVEKLAGITPAQAAAMTDQYMEKLGLSDFSPKRIELSLSSRYNTDPIGLGSEEYLDYQDAAYQIIYTRDLRGFPITPDNSNGGVLEYTDDSGSAWGYEKVEFYVNQEGLQKASIQNLYEIQKPMIDNVELMSFSDITEIFWKIMPVRFQNNTDKININRITLGYMKIYDPGLSSTTGLLVPVWDFFGTREIYDPDTGEPYTMTYPTTSFLTINAADGTVINRNYGY